MAYLLKEGGTRSRALCQLTRDIYKVIDRNGITLRPAFLPGVANAEADSLSRGTAPQEWTLAPKVARQLFRVWGTPRIDLFASRDSHQVPAYFTLDRHDHMAQGHDALLQPWNQGLLWAFPPPSSYTKFWPKPSRTGHL